MCPSSIKNVSSVNKSSQDVCVLRCIVSVCNIFNTIAFLAIHSSDIVSFPESEKYKTQTHITEFTTFFLPFKIAFSKFISFKYTSRARVQLRPNHLFEWKIYKRFEIGHCVSVWMNMSRYVDFYRLISQRLSKYYSLIVNSNLWWLSYWRSLSSCNILISVEMSCNRNLYISPYVQLSKQKLSQLGKSLFSVALIQMLWTLFPILIAFRSYATTEL